ncbi:MAG: DinB family protein [Bryobacteraceae bacterium]
MQKQLMVSVLAISVLAAAPAMAADGGALNDAERAFLIEQMEMSKKAFLASISGLSEAQWTFKPAPNVWSVQECAEHIVLSESFIFDSAMQVLKTPAVPRPEKSNAAFDQQLAIGVQDRSHKATAPAPIDPVGRAATLTRADAARQFTEKRDSNEAYVKSTSDDLRTHVAAGPAGPMDAYQFLILMADHTARHTAQIKEVQANANYPAK